VAATEFNAGGLRTKGAGTLTFTNWQLSYIGWVAGITRSYGDSNRLQAKHCRTCS